MKRQKVAIIIRILNKFKAKRAARMTSHLVSGPGKAISKFLPRVRMVSGICCKFRLGGASRGHSSEDLWIAETEVDSENV